MIRGIRTGVTFCALAMAFAATAQMPPAHDSRLPDAPSQVRGRQIVSAGAPLVTRQSLTAPAGTPYQPLTRRQKLNAFVHHTYSPYTILNAMYNATYAQTVGDPREYGGGMEGWGKRFGAAMAGTEVRSFFGTFLFPALLHQDSRYFAMDKGSKRKRALHAISRVVVARADDGHNTFNSSGLLTTAFTEGLATAWIPEGQRSVGPTFRRMAGALQGDAASYLLREFTPDLQRLFLRHCPRKLKKLQEKIPPQITGMPRGD